MARFSASFREEITIAAKIGGGDPAANVRLRSAILSARGQSMPNDNIERAIKRGTGEGAEAQHFDEIVYEGYAPGGVAVIVEAATDNKNRTAAEIRRIFSKNDGNLGTSGSVSYMFHKKGRITVPRETIAEERIFELALEAGAEELTTEEEQYVITTSHDQLYAVAEALKHAGVTTDGQKFTFIPDTTVPVIDEAVRAPDLAVVREPRRRRRRSKRLFKFRYSRRVAGQIAGVERSCR